MTVVRLARVYEPAGPADGVRVLIDRLWPRGVSRESADIDHWCGAVAPSNELRRWYGHDPALFDDFAERYRDELAEQDAAAALAALRGLARSEPVTLLTATRALAFSHATVLARLLGGPAPDGP